MTIDRPPVDPGVRRVSARAGSALIVWMLLVIGLLAGITWATAGALSSGALRLAHGQGDWQTPLGDGTWGLWFVAMLFLALASTVVALTEAHLWKANLRAWVRCFTGATVVSLVGTGILLWVWIDSETQAHTIWFLVGLALTHIAVRLRLTRRMGTVDITPARRSTHAEAGLRAMLVTLAAGPAFMAAALFITGYNDFSGPAEGLILLIGLPLGAWCALRMRRRLLEKP